MRQCNILFIFLCYCSIFQSNVRAYYFLYNNDFDDMSECPVGEICVKKCCPFTEQVRDGICQIDLHNRSDTTIPMYNRTVRVETTARLLKSRYLCDTFLIRFQDYFSGKSEKYYLQTINHSIYAKNSNNSIKDIAFCADYYRNLPEMQYFICDYTSSYSSKKDHPAYVGAKILNTVLQGIVCLAYIILKRYRRLRHQLLIWHMITFSISNMTDNKIWSISRWTFVSSFCWFTILSFDYWVEFSEINPAFTIYNVYVWSSLLIIAIVCFENSYSVIASLLVLGFLNTILYLSMLKQMWFQKRRFQNGMSRNRIILSLFALSGMNWMCYVYDVPNFRFVPISTRIFTLIIEVMYNIIMFHIYVANKRTFYSLKEAITNTKNRND